MNRLVASRPSMWGLDKRLYYTEHSRIIKIKAIVRQRVRDKMTWQQQEHEEQRGLVPDPARHFSDEELAKLARVFARLRIQVADQDHLQKDV